MRLKSMFVVIAVIIFLATMLFSATGKRSAWAQTLPDNPTPVPTDEASWLRLPDLPADATQADVGAEIYRLVCQDCHGDKGLGLTKEWIATWDESDQNCWQAKCHASNHPPEGFVLPRYVPPLMGSTALARFETSSDLYDYMQQSMPFHNPGSLQEYEYWQLAAFLVRENGLDMPSNMLDYENIVRLHNQADVTAVTIPTATPKQEMPTPTPKSTPKWPFDGWIWAFIGVLLFAGAIFSITYFARR